MPFIRSTYDRLDLILKLNGCCLLYKVIFVEPVLVGKWDCHANKLIKSHRTSMPLWFTVCLRK